jgi:hypothetical protein
MGRGSEVQGTVQLLSCSGEKRFTEIFGTVHLEFCTGEEAYLTGLLHRDSGFGYSAELKTGAQRNRSWVESLRKRWAMASDCSAGQ